MFETKIALVVREDLQTWQKLNVAAFLTSGVLGADPCLLGEPYRDSAGNIYAPLIIQPVIVLCADATTLATIHRRTLDRGVPSAIYTDKMFGTGHDAANRAVVRDCAPEALELAGLGIRNDRKLVDKITRGARPHR